MLLHGLLELVKTLQARIGARGNTLSELQTRYELIDPLLRELGWDTADPEQVVVEYSLGKKRADYALHKNGSPVMIVEAKAASASLEDAPNQAFDYSRRSIGARYFAVTNGVRWEIYDIRQPAEDMMIVSFDLKEQSPAEVCLKSLALWGPSVESGYVAAGTDPIIEKPSSGTEEPPLPPGSGWKPLSELDMKTMPDTGPKGIRFPDGSDVVVPEYRRAVPELVRWLTDNGKLSEPVRASSPGKLIVSRDGRHSDGSQMRMTLEANGWFVSVQGGWWRHFFRAIRIIKHAGMDLSEFHLRFD